MQCHFHTQTAKHALCLIHCFFSVVPFTQDAVTHFLLSTKSNNTGDSFFRLFRALPATSDVPPESTTTAITTTSEPKNLLEDRTSASCITWSRDHVTTFDGTQITVEKTCPYLLSAVVDRSWVVSVRNVDCDLISTCRKQIEFTIGLEEIIILGSEVTVSGRSVNSLPFVGSGECFLIPCQRLK